MIVQRRISARATLFSGTIALLVTTSLASSHIGAFGGAVQDSGAIARQVEEIENRRLAAMEKGDIDEVAKYIADGFMATSGTGRVSDRDEYLSRLRSATMPRPHLIHDDVRVRVYGDTAIVTGRSRSVVNGQEQAGQVRYTHVYVNRDGSWRMVAMHVTTVAGPAR